MNGMLDVMHPLVGRVEPARSLCPQIHHQDMPAHPQHGDGAHY